MVKDREAWHATVHRVTKSWTRVSNRTTTFYLFTWLHQVLVAGCRIFVASCGNFGSGGWAQELQYAGLVTAWCMWAPSSLTRDQTHIPRIARWILNHWTTREVPPFTFSIKVFNTVEMSHYNFVFFFKNLTLWQITSPHTITCLGNILFWQNRSESEKKVKVAQSCPTLCDPVDCTVHGILQARTLERAAFPFSRGSSQPRDRTPLSHTAGIFFTSWDTREA